jgi:hypothetical protein
MEKGRNAASAMTVCIDGGDVRKILTGKLIFKWAEKPCQMYLCGSKQFFDIVGELR